MAAVYRTAPAQTNPRTGCSCLSQKRSIGRREAAGGPAFYTGRDMKTAHAGMGIPQRDWEVFHGHTRAMLDAVGVGGRERGEGTLTAP